MIDYGNLTPLACASLLSTWLIVHHLREKARWRAELLQRHAKAQTVIEDLKSQLGEAQQVSTRLEGERDRLAHELAERDKDCQSMASETAGLQAKLNLCHNDLTATKLELDKAQDLATSWRNQCAAAERTAGAKEGLVTVTTRRDKHGRWTYTARLGKDFLCSSGRFLYADHAVRQARRLLGLRWSVEVQSATPPDDEAVETPEASDDD